MAEPRGKDNEAFEPGFDQQRGPASSVSSSSSKSSGNAQLYLGPQDSGPNDTSDRDRAMWDRPLEFLLSCVAMSVGLGNFWRFPTVAYENGGGAFLIPYIVVLIFIGRPLYFLELSIGQFASRSSVQVWNMVPAFKGIGYAQAIATFSVVSYYCSIIAIAMFYFAMSFSKVLPWSWCDPDWANLETCFDINDLAISNENNTNSTEFEIPALQYFRDYVLEQPADLSNGPGSPDWKLTLCLIASWLIICGALIKGVKTSGKASYVTALFPYIGLITLLISNCTLPGAGDGISYFITPQWEKILEAKVWYAAISQCFFSLSVGFGPIVMFSSHNNFRQNIYRDATFISVMDTVNSLLSGFTVFSAMGYLKHITKAPDFDSIVSGGTSLVFIVYPSALASFKSVPQLPSVLFFMVLMTLGFGSAMALCSMVIDIIADRFTAINRLYVTLGVCISSFLVGLVFVTPGGQWVLDLVDFFGGGFIIYIIAMCETVAVFWFYGHSNFMRDMRFMLRIKLGFYWSFCYVFFVPVAMFAIFIYYLATFETITYNGGLSYPTVGLVFGWLLCGTALFMLPLCWFISFRQAHGFTSTEKAKNTLSPSTKHRPRLDCDHEAWKIYCREETVNYTSEDGGTRMDLWRRFAKEAVETPEKLTAFNSLVREVREKHGSWDTFKDENKEDLVTRIRNKLRR